MKIFKNKKYITCDKKIHTSLQNLKIKRRQDPK